MSIFHFHYVNFKFEIHVDKEYLSILWPFRNLTVNAKKIVKISHKPMSFPMHDGRLYTYLYIYYLNENNKVVKRTYSIPVEDPLAQDFFKCLSETYPHASYIGPHAKEKEQILNRINRYSLEKTYPLVFHIIILAVSVLMISMDAWYPTLNETIRFILWGIMLYSLLWFILLIARRIYVIKTSEKGLTVVKFFVRKHVPWDTCSVKFVRNRLFRHKSRNNAIISYSEIELKKNKKPIVLHLTITSNARLFKELYYRNIVSFDMAQKALAFM